MNLRRRILLLAGKADERSGEAVSGACAIVPLSAYPLKEPLWTYETKPTQNDASHGRPMTDFLVEATTIRDLHREDSLRDGCGSSGLMAYMFGACHRSERIRWYP